MVNDDVRFRWTVGGIRGSEACGERREPEPVRDPQVCMAKLGVHARIELRRGGRCVCRVFDVDEGNNRIGSSALKKVCSRVVGGSPAAWLHIDWD